jgi:hypothetical protein
LQEPPPYWSEQKKAGYWAEAKLIAAALTEKNDYLEQRLGLKIEAYQKFI